MLAIARKPKRKRRGTPKRASPATQIDDFFAGEPRARALFRVVYAAVARFDATMRVTKSQIAFATGPRPRAFAWVWVPSRYLSGKRPPLVLSVALPRRDRSRRWKEVVEPSPGRFMHHLELTTPEAIDDEVMRWLAEGAAAAVAAH